MKKAKKQRQRQERLMRKRKKRKEKQHKNAHPTTGPNRGLAPQSPQLPPHIELGLMEFLQGAMLCPQETLGSMVGDMAELYRCARTPLMQLICDLIEWRLEEKKWPYRLGDLLRFEHFFLRSGYQPEFSGLIIAALVHETDLLSTPAQESHWPFGKLVPKQLRKSVALYFDDDDTLKLPLLLTLASNTTGDSWPMESALKMAAPYLRTELPKRQATQLLSLTKKIVRAKRLSANAPQKGLVSLESLIKELSAKNAHHLDDSKVTRMLLTAIGRRIILSQAEPLDPTVWSSRFPYFSQFVLGYDFYRYASEHHINERLQEMRNCCPHCERRLFEELVDRKVMPFPERIKLDILRIKSHRQLVEMGLATQNAPIRDRLFHLYEGLFDQLANPSSSDQQVIGTHVQAYMLNYYVKDSLALAHHQFNHELNEHLIQRYPSDYRLAVLQFVAGALKKRNAASKGGNLSQDSFDYFEEAIFAQAALTLPGHIRSQERFRKLFFDPLSLDQQKRCVRTLFFRIFTKHTDPDAVLSAQTIQMFCRCYFSQQQKLAFQLTTSGVVEKDLLFYVRLALHIGGTQCPPLEEAEQQRFIEQALQMVPQLNDFARNKLSLVLLPCLRHACLNDNPDLAISIIRLIDDKVLSTLEDTDTISVLIKRLEKPFEVNPWENVAQLLASRVVPSAPKRWFARYLKRFHKEPTGRMPARQ